MIPAINSAALLISRLTLPISAGNGTATGVNLIATANGVSDPAAGETGAQPTPLQAKLSDAMFSVNNFDSNKLKVDLFKRVGKAFGIDQADYDSQSSYGSAIKQAVSVLASQPNGAQTIAEIEKGLGLDKLGVSLTTVVNAIIDPGSDDDDKLDTALKKQAGEDLGTGSHAAGVTVRFDEIGLYSPAS